MLTLAAIPVHLLNCCEKSLCDDVLKDNLSLGTKGELEVLQAIKKDSRSFSGYICSTDGIAILKAKSWGTHQTVCSPRQGSGPIVRIYNGGYVP